MRIVDLGCSGVVCSESALLFVVTRSEVLLRGIFWLLLGDAPYFGAESNVLVDATLGFESGEDGVGLVGVLAEVVLNRACFCIVLNLVEVVFARFFNRLLLLLDV
jgi:hypothetical protein